MQDEPRREDHDAPSVQGADPTRRQREEQTEEDLKNQQRQQTERREYGSRQTARRGEPFRRGPFSRTFRAGSFRHNSDARPARQPIRDVQRFVVSCISISVL